MYLCVFPLTEFILIKINVIQLFCMDIYDRIQELVLSPSYSAVGFVRI